MSISIIKNKKDWQDLLVHSNKYDFCHTYEYHQICKSYLDEVLLVKYQKDNILIGLPLLLKPISNTEYFDAISVYGYGGPIYNTLPDHKVLENFSKSLIQHLYEIKVVSVFFRLHPYIPCQNDFFHKLGDLVCLGRVINIDITKDLTLQKHGYSRRLKNQVNKAYRNCIIKKGTSKADLEIFKTLYFENMERVNANSFYYFNDAYFKQMINAKEFKTEILLAYDRETKTPIAGCMFIKTKDIVQYHLSAATAEYLHLNGTKVLIDSMRQTATAEGYTFFNLGGGLGANSGDSLFRFKSAFSNDFKYYCVWKHVIRQDIYDELCLQNDVSDKELDYFPKYRYKDFDDKF